MGQRRALDSSPSLSRPWLYKCTIETQLRSFYFKMFYNAIALNSLLYKIGRRDSPLCYFCQELPETLTHIFCKSTEVARMGKKLADYIDNMTKETTLNFEFAHILGIDIGGRLDVCIFLKTPVPQMLYYSRGRIKYTGFPLFCKNETEN